MRDAEGTYSVDVVQNFDINPIFYAISMSCHMFALQPIEAVLTGEITHPQTSGFDGTNQTDAACHQLTTNGFLS